MITIENEETTAFIQNNEKETANSNKDRPSGSSQEGSIFSEPEHEKSSEFELSNNLFKGFTGIGILAIPYGYSQCGLIIGIIMTILIAYLCYYCIILILDVVDEHPVKVKRYADLGKLILGKWGSRAISIFVVSLCIGTCISYILFFVEFFENVFCHEKIEYFCGKRIKLICLVLAIIIPLSMINTISKYSKVSIVANAFIFISLLIVIIYSGWNSYSNGNQDIVMYNFKEIPFFLGIVCFSLEAINVIFEIRNSSQNKQVFRNVFAKQSIITAILYIVLGSVCYIGFPKNKLEELVLFSLPMDKFYSLFVQLIYALVLCMSYPLQIYPAFILCDDIYNKIKRKFSNEIPKENENPGKIRKIVNYLSRVVLCFLLAFIAYFIPNISSFLSLLGNFSTGSLGFIMPIILFHSYKNNISKAKTIINFTFFVFGIVALVVGVYFSLKKLIK